MEDEFDGSFLEIDIDEIIEHELYETDYLQDEKNDIFLDFEKY